MVDVKSKTEKAIAQGLSLEEFIASKPTAKYDQTCGKNFLGIVYQSLTWE